MKKKQIKAIDPAKLTSECRRAAGYPSIYAASVGAEISSGTLHRIEFGQQDPTIGCLGGILAKMGYRLRLIAEPMDK